jgi:hypothetical protein
VLALIVGGVSPRAEGIVPSAGERWGWP